MQTKERFDRESGRRKLQWRRQLFDTMARNHRDLLLNDQQIPELYLPWSKYFCSYLCSYLCSDWCSYLCSDLFVPIELTFAFFIWAPSCVLHLSSDCIPILRRDSTGEVAMISRFLRFIFFGLNTCVRIYILICVFRFVFSFEFRVVFSFVFRRVSLSVLRFVYSHLS